MTRLWSVLLCGIIGLTTLSAHAEGYRYCQAQETHMGKMVPHKFYSLAFFDTGKTFREYAESYKDWVNKTYHVESFGSCTDPPMSREDAEKAKAEDQGWEERHGSEVTETSWAGN